jgi:hypothetical protein
MAAPQKSVPGTNYRRTWVQKQLPDGLSRTLKMIF